MAFNRGFSQHSAPSPWAAGAPPYGPQQQMNHPGPFNTGGGGFGGMSHFGGQHFGGGGGMGPGGHFGIGGPGPIQGGFNHPPVFQSRMGSLGASGPMNRGVGIVNRQFNQGATGKRPGVAYPADVQPKRPNVSIRPNVQNSNNRFNRNVGQVMPQTANKKANPPNQAPTNNQVNKPVTPNANKNQNRNQNQGNKNQKQATDNKKDNLAIPAFDTVHNKYVVSANGFWCKLCEVFLRDKGARAEHVKTELHSKKFEEAESASGPQNTSTPVVKGSNQPTPKATPKVVESATPITTSDTAKATTTPVNAAEVKTPEVNGGVDDKSVKETSYLDNNNESTIIEDSAGNTTTESATSEVKEEGSQDEPEKPAEATTESANETATPKVGRGGATRGRGGQGRGRGGRGRGRGARGRGR